MKISSLIKYSLSIIILSYYPLSTYAHLTTHQTLNDKPKQYVARLTESQGPVIDRARAEEKIPLGYYGIAFYKPNYILPYYFTGSPYNKIYEGYTPNDESLTHNEFKFQISLKVPLWKNIFNRPSSIYAAYSQLSYWQLYNKDSFMRENDYEPEFFLANEVKWHLFNDWNVNFINVGLNHQSNGFGNALQRGWNRLYVEAIASSTHWMFSIKPWYAITKNGNNDDILQYLGYGKLMVAYKANQHVLSLQAHSLIEQSGRRATGEISWSFPITRYIKGYIQGFSGYGQSLIEYNHRTNSIGVGFALSDWV